MLFKKISVFVLTVLGSTVARPLSRK